MSIAMSNGKLDGGTAESHGEASSIFAVGDFALANKLELMAAYII